MKHIFGSWRDARGNRAFKGQLHLKLNQDAVIPATGQNAPREVEFELQQNGALRPGAQIWANDELLPAGTYYVLSVTALGGGLIWGPTNVYIAGSDPVDLNLAIPLPGIAGLEPFAAGQNVVFTRPPLQAGVMNARVSDLTTWAPASFVTVSDQFVLAGASGVSIVASKSLDSLTASIAVSIDSDVLPVFSAAALGNTVTNQIVLVGGNNLSLGTSTDSHGMTVTMDVSADIEIVTHPMTLAAGPNINLSSGTGPSGTTITISASNQTFSAGSVNLVAGANIGVTSGSNASGSTFTISGASGGSAGGGGGAVAFWQGPNITIASATNTAGTTASFTGAAGGTGGGGTGGGPYIGLGGAASGGIIDGFMGVVQPNNLLFVAGSNIALSAETLPAGTGTASTIPNSFNLSLNAKRLQLVEGSNITLATLADSQGTIATINAGGGGGTAGGNFYAGISGGNSVGQSAIVNNNLMLAGGPNITLSGATNTQGMTVSISGLSGGTGGGGSFHAGISGGNTDGTSGTVSNQLVLAGGNNVTLSGSSNTAGMTVSINGAAGGTGSGGSFIAGVSSGNFGSIGALSTNHTGTVSNRFIIYPGANITLWPQTNSAGMSLSINAGIGAPRIGIVDLTGSQSTFGGTTAGINTNIAANDIRIFAGSNILLSATTYTYTAGATNLTSTNYSLTIFAAGGTGGGSGGGAMQLVPGSNVSISSVSVAGMGTTATINAAAGATAGGGGISNVSLLNYGGVVQGDTAFTDVHNLQLVAGSNITFSGVSGTGITTLGSSISGNWGAITINGAAGGTAGGGSFLAGLSSTTGGGTLLASASGDLGPVNNQIMLVPAANITLGGSTNAAGMTVSLSVPRGVGFGFSSAPGGATTGQGYAGYIPGSFRLFAGSNITFSVGTSANSNLSVTINAGAGGAGGDSRYLANAWPIMPSYTTISDWQLYNQGVIFWPFQPGITNSNCNSANAFFYFNMPNSGTAYGTFDASFGIYTRNGTSLSRMTSGSTSYRWSYSYGINRTNYDNLKMIKIPMQSAMNFDARDYWGAFCVNTSSSSQSFGLSVLAAQMRSGDMAGELGAATASSWQQVPGWGLYTNFNSLPATVGFSDLQGTAGTNQRAPLLYLVGFTA